MAQRVRTEPDSGAHISGCGQLKDFGLLNYDGESEKEVDESAKTCILHRIRFLSEDRPEPV
jgi:hypothetical protein